MEEDSQSTPSTPFWLQSSTYFNSSNGRRPRRSSSSICLNSGFLIVILFVTAVITIFIVVPAFLSFTSQFFKPNLVKKSWDSVNFVLVLFAILCGVFGRRNNDGDDGVVSNAAQVSDEVPQTPSPPAPPVAEAQQSWFGFSDEARPVRANVVGRMKRNSSSYPDLREVSSWEAPDENWRYYDDSYVYNQRAGSNYVHCRKQRQVEELVHDSGFKTIPVDTYVASSRLEVPSASPPQVPLTPRQSTPPPPPPPPPPRRSEKKVKVKQNYQSVARKENLYVREMEVKKTPPPPPPPPPPEDFSTSRSEKKVKKLDRKKSGAKEFTSTLASLYNQRKRKKKTRSMESFDDVFPSPSYLYSEPPSFRPPPPPPPPPTSVFQQLFKKSGKSKRIHSVSASPFVQRAPPPPPPPPPPMSPLRPPMHKTRPQRPMPQQQQQPPPSPPPPPSESPSKISRSRKPGTPGRPPLPSKINSFYEENTGNQSPLIPMPPPPPPPPFKMSGYKFIVRGDYARLLSSNSMQSNSPDLDTPPTSTPSTPSRTEGGSPFCPSPDVNTKADSFIKRFRAGLRMEKVNSFNEKQESGPIPSPRSSQNTN